MPHSHRQKQKADRQIALRTTKREGTHHGSEKERVVSTLFYSTGITRLMITGQIG